MKRKLFVTGVALLNGAMAQIAWPDRVLAPYLYTSPWNSFDVKNAFKQTGHNIWTLCFIVADYSGKPSWNGDSSIDNQFFSDYINEIRSLGGDVIVSFGGASGKLKLNKGKEIATVTYDINELARKYQTIIDKYALTYIDIDIEGSATFDKASVERRNKALKIVRNNNPGIIISYTLATNHWGLSDENINILKNALSVGFELDGNYDLMSVVNLMAMDYGYVDNGGALMGTYAISAAEGTYNQLQNINMKNAKIGITPMIGQNDIQDEIFTISNAKQVANWAKGKNWIRTIAFWSINRDTSKRGDLFSSSQVVQKDFEFLKRMQKWSAQKGSSSGKKVTTADDKKHPASVQQNANNKKSNWPLQFVAPYLYSSEWFPIDLVDINDITGQKYWTMCFIVADKNGNPSWNGDENLEKNVFHKYFNTIRGFKGDAIVSFGGATGKELAIVTKDVNQLADKYQHVIDTYHLTYIDIDIEGYQISDRTSIERRSKALKIIQKNNPNLLISYTLATNSWGMDDDVFYTIESAKAEGLQLDVVNIMAMDYGNVSNGKTGMGGYAISAAEGLRKQLDKISLQNVKVGITPMIGQNDVASEIFRVEDAKQLAEWAKDTKWVRLLSYWSMNRDYGKNGDLFISSQVKQSKYEFLKTMQKFESANAYQQETSTKRIYSPYVDITAWPIPDINTIISSKSGAHFILGFMGSNKWGNPAWGGNVPLEENFYLDVIQKARQFHSEITISFGGVESSDIALFNSDALKLQDKYEWVIGTYSPERIDFYLTEEAIKNTKANAVRAKAILGLKAKFSNILFQVSIPLYKDGLSKEGINLLSDAKSNGVEFDIINLLAHDIDNGNSKASNNIITAVEYAIKQVDELNLSSSNIGITPMIGKNNANGIVFQEYDAEELYKYADSNNRISLLSIWSVNRDTSISGSLYTSSNVNQENLAFSKIFRKFNK